MTIHETMIGKYLQISLNGRLDATWSGYVQETFLKQIRSGQHHLLIDVENLTFLSSAGIRTLMLAARELASANGTFQLLGASAFVEKTIRLTGLGHWLAQALPDDVRGESAIETAAFSAGHEEFALGQGAPLTIKTPAVWKPWQMLSEDSLLKSSFPANKFALGIGSAADVQKDALNQLGDFLAVAGHVVFQPPGNNLRPDYLIQTKDYIPEMEVIQLIETAGAPSHHFRFSPDGTHTSYGMASLADKALQLVQSRTALLVLVAEIHGLVGASVSRSPGLNISEEAGRYPEIRQWVSFTGEPLYQGQQCLVVGFVSANEDAESLLLKPLPAQPGLWGHFHAAVFPYQVLPNGQIDLRETVARFFYGPPPLAMMHLIDDQRQILGVGETTFIRGAGWCAPVQKTEETI